MNELIDIQKILNDDSGSFSTLEYQLAERVEKDEQQRDEAIERAAHWKDQHDKAMVDGKRMERERDEALAALHLIEVRGRTGATAQQLSNVAFEALEADNE